MGHEKKEGVSPSDVSQKTQRSSSEATEIAAAVAEKAMPSRSRSRISMILMALYLSMFVAALDQTIVATAIPTITSDLHSASGSTWIGGAYLLAKAAAMPIWAKLSDIWGRKPIILTTLLLFAASSILCALSRTMPTLLLGRAIQGVGGGGLMQLATITITDIFSPRQRSLYLSLAQVLWAIAGGAGPVLGGVLASTWRWIFWLNVPITLLAALLTLLALDVHNPRTPLRTGLRAIDWPGAFALLATTVPILLGLNLGGTSAAHPWSSPLVVVLLLAGALSLPLFLVAERHATHPILPLRLFRRPSFAGAFATTALHGFVALGLEYYVPQYLQTSLSLSPAASGVYTLPLVLATALSALGMGVVIHATGAYTAVLRAGAVVMTIGVALFVSQFHGGTASMAAVVGLQVLAGVGVGACFLPPAMAVQVGIEQADVAAAMAALGFGRNVATAVSVVAGGAVAGDGGGAFKGVWILYACVAGGAVVAAGCVRGGVLSEEHTETKTGVRRVGDGEMGQGAAGYAE